MRQTFFFCFVGGGVLFAYFGVSLKDPVLCNVYKQKVSVATRKVSFFKDLFGCGVLLVWHFLLLFLVS